MVVLNAFLADLPPERQMLLMNLKPGDVLWIRVPDWDDQHIVDGISTAISETLDFLGLKGSVACILTAESVEIQKLDDFEMEKFGWVRKP